MYDKVGYRFLLLFFSQFLFVIVLINFTGWSGAYIDFTGSASNPFFFDIGTSNYWDNTYFGFTSFQSMINAYGNTLDKYEWLSWPRFINNLQKLVDVCSLNLPKAVIKMGQFANGQISWDWAEFFSLISIIFTWPVLALFYGIWCAIQVIWYITAGAIVLLYAVQGQFNVPMQQLPSIVTSSSQAIMPLLQLGF